ncbi:hypothetical protein KVT40_006667 [Elsinoe batatas]|uniref:Uncharacterized protein n=1 Tax=Elsinoe batatas TaxID=2601811 RepID=A0A8K0PCT1_9PEZI|nr:hypothetical protein KVT40_006667 [Elsinoe batatas]
MTRIQRFYPRVVGVFIVITVGLWIVSTQSQVFTSYRHHEPAQRDEEPGLFHLVIPASHPDINLCKTLVSASILGYPKPSLLNWGINFDDPGLVEGGSHVAKVTGMLEFLNGLDGSRGEDLVLMVDGYDIWFQLRPQLLLDRFFDINAVADHRSNKLYGVSDKLAPRVHQKTVISSQKRCWPWNATDAPCAAVPPSTLPAQIYGSSTDVLSTDERFTYRKIRQRYLNSGVIMGTVDSLKVIFSRAEELMRASKNFGSDQYILSQVFGEQEVSRHERLQKQQTSSDVNTTRTPFREYGLGLDYESRLGLATVFAEEDTQWITYSNATSVQQARSECDVPSDNTRMDKCQEDVQGSRPPFWTLTTENLPKDRSWKDVSLFTNVWTGVVPAIIHHNAHQNGMKSLRDTWWERLWLQEHASTLHDAAERQPLGPLGYADRRFWWPVEKNDKGVRVQRDGGWNHLSFGDDTDAFNLWAASSCGIPGSAADMGEQDVSSTWSSRRWKLLLAVVPLLLVLSSLWATWGSTSLLAATHIPLTSGNATKASPSPRAHLHLLIPATSSNPDLCKLLLSATILGYPVPVLINHGQPEQADPYVQHLAKVEGLLNYFHRMKALSSRNDDLFLVVDGFDIWFQLTPDVLLKRYFQINEAFLDRASQTYGWRGVTDPPIRQTILFGPDKLCWPTDFNRPACWAVPKAPLSKSAFGPLTIGGVAESIFTSPDWLNSGTIIGPLDPLIKLFEATLDRIRNNFTMNSDQLYFADLFGEQELSRRRLLNTSTTINANTTQPTVPIPSPPEIATELATTDFGVGIDYLSSLFQTVAFNKDWLVWTTIPRNRPDKFPHPIARLEAYYSYALPADILASPFPMSLLSPNHSTSITGWDDVDLCINTVTREIPVLVHFTGEKHLRTDWWDRMWYYERAKELRLAAVAGTHEYGRLYADAIGGKVWFGAEPEDSGRVSGRGQGGAWSDTGGWFPWNALCRGHEGVLYGGG